MTAVDHSRLVAPFDPIHSSPSMHITAHLRGPRLQVPATTSASLTHTRPRGALNRPPISRWAVQDRFPFTSASKRASKESPIIADLAGKRQNRYAQTGALEKLLPQFAQAHTYTKRFQQFLASSFRKRSQGEQKRLRGLALKIIHQLASDGRARRSDVVQNLLADTAKYARDQIDDMIVRMHNAGLINSVQGPYSTVTIT